MIFTQTYPNCSEGLLALQFNEVFPSFSTGLSVRPCSTPTVEKKSDISTVSSFVFAFSLALSMASISSGLSISFRKRRMKAKFNREAYARSIQVSVPETTNLELARPHDIYSFEIPDYYFHIRETSGKVLPCSEAWFE